MVHKRFVRRGNKVYGPYLYNSKRVGNKVVNEYLGIDKSGEWKKAGIILAVFALLLLGIVYANYTAQSGSSSGLTSNLTIWDGSSTSMDSVTWYTPKTHGCSPGKEDSKVNVMFYANYSNSTVGPIYGNCTIRFNFTGTYTEFFNMNYSETTKFYEFNRTFNRRVKVEANEANFTFQVNCSNSTYDTLSTTDYFFIGNSKPFAYYCPSAETPIQSCREDTTCTYNASANFSDDDSNDLPLSNFQIFNYTSGFGSCVSIAASTGIVSVRCTTSSQAGSHYVNVLATDGRSAPSDPITIPYIINASNDYPIITASTLTQTCTEDTLCSFYIGATDEENGTISSGTGTGIGFLTFTDNSTWFEINSTNGSISFTPDNSKVGTHRIEINVTDPNGDTNTSVLTLTIMNANDPPNLTYACDNIDGQILQEDVNFSCMLNTSDSDEGDTHTYTANYSWFTISCGSQTVTDGNTSCNVTFAPTDIAVFTHWINLTVTDSGGISSSRIINFSVDNVPDFPRWTNLSTNYTAWANVSFWYQVNATDDDSLTVFGDNVTYFANYSWFNINRTSGIIIFNNTELNDKVGTYWINITANDTTNRQNSTVINFTIYPNSHPYLTIRQEYNMTEGYAFSLNISANVTEPDGDYVNYTDNTSLFNINAATGMIEFTPTDNNVGTHWVAINITDSHSTTNTSIFNFTVYNEEDAPVLGIIYNITNASIGTAYTFKLNFTDADFNINGSAETINVLANLSNSWFSLNVSVNRNNATNGFVNFDVTFTPGPNSNGTYWINITLNDSAGLGDSQIFFINVTEGGFAPYFIDTDGAAGYFCQIRTATEDSDFTAGCTIWACDNDTSGTLRFDANYSWFTFNKSNLATSADFPGASWGYCANTTVNLSGENIPDYNIVGNWSILLNVTDNTGFSANYTLFFNISSVNDAPVLVYIPALNASIDSTFTFYVNVTDEEDGNISAGSGAIGNFTFSDNTTLFEINSTTGLIRWTPNLSHAGIHFINITVNDTGGKEDSQIINITVAENAAPICSSMIIYYPPPTYLTTINPQTEYLTINMSENERINFTVNCNDPEGEAITFKWYWNYSLNRTSTSSSGTGSKSELWSYRTTYFDSGYYNMTLLVYDSSDMHNNSYYIIVNVSNVNAPPMMNGTIPEIRTLNDGTGWYNNVQNSRNMIAYFYDLDGDNLSYSWYRQAINETFSDNNLSRINATWNLSGTWAMFEDTSGNYAIKQNDTSGLKYAQLGSMDYTNITEFKARIKLLSSNTAGICFGSLGCSYSGQRVFFNSTDNRTYLEYLSEGTVSYSNSSSAISITRNESYWIKAIESGNLTTIYTSSNGTDWDLAYNQSINASTGNAYLFTINSEAVFDDIALKDPDLRNITLADVGGNNITFTPKTDWYGDLLIIIRASDGINYTDSNEFNLHVDKVNVPPPEVVTQTTTSSSTRTETKVADMAILVPSMISLTPLSKTIVPIILKNTGQLDLNTITLVAKSNQTELKLNLNETSWPIIKIGNSIYVNLDVDIGLLAPDRYTIRLDAESQSPALKRFAEIVVDVREKDAVLKAQLKEMIQFTRDLFLQNPECLELTELINEAEEKFRTYQYEEGLEIIHRANQGCKEFIAAKEGEDTSKFAETAKTFIQEHWKTIILEAIGLIIAILLLIYYFQRRSVAKL